MIGLPVFKLNKTYIRQNTRVDLISRMWGFHQRQYIHKGHTQQFKIPDHVWESNPPLVWKAYIPLTTSRQQTSRRYMTRINKNCYGKENSNLYRIKAMS